MDARFLRTVTEEYTMTLSDQYNGTATEPPEAEPPRIDIIVPAVFLVVFIALVILVCCCYWKRRRRNETSLTKPTQENRGSSSNLYYVLEPLEAGAESTLNREGDMHKDSSVKIVSIKQRIRKSIIKSYRKNSRTRSSDSAYDHIELRHVGDAAEANGDDLGMEITSALSHNSVVQSELLQEIVEFFSSPSYRAQTTDEANSTTVDRRGDNSLAKGGNSVAKGGNSLQMGDYHNVPLPLVRKTRPPSDNYDHIGDFERTKTSQNRPSDNYEHIDVPKGGNLHELDVKTNIYDRVRT